MENYLADAWEPFAVTETEGTATVWLLRPTEREYAGIARPKGPWLERETERLVDGIDPDMDDE